MKAIRVIGFIVGLCALIYYGYQLIGKPNGKKYTMNDKHHIYYKGDGVTEDDAKKVGNYFTNIGMFGDTDMDVQIGADKNSSDMKVRFVVDKSKITPEVESAFLNIGNDMANKIYPDKTLHIILADEHFDDIKDLGTAKASQLPTQNNNGTQSNPETNQTDDAK